MKIPNLPSRFENFKLSQHSSYTQSELERLKAFIFQVEEPTKHIKRMIRTMKASNSGAFMILMGESGIGKTTFLNTLPLYIENLEVRSIYNRKPLDKEIDIIKECNIPRIIILENRETFETLSTNQLEKEIHAINRFIRSDKGLNTVIVWPCNGEDMTREIIQFAGHVGGASLFREDTILEYKGPSRDRFVSILKNTYEFFNKYDISDVGFSDDQIENVLNSMNKKSTIGDFLEKIRTELLNNYNKIVDSKDYVGDLFDLIVCVVASNNPKNEIEYLTKGDYSIVDIDRLFSTTGANIKATIGKHKRICSMVAKEINCKIVSIDWQDALEVLKIKTECKDADIESFNKYIEDKCKLKLGKSNNQLEILRTMNLTSSIKGLPYKRKNSIGNSTGRQDAFNTILELSRTNDSQINKKICEVLKENGFINVGRVENSFGNGYYIRSDMLCSIPGKYIRVEFMWRKIASAADISLYTLNKLYGYCKAMRVV
jgi:energy-coupling factor transporter ATP-binding protein EcfA2